MQKALTDKFSAGSLHILTAVTGNPSKAGPKTREFPMATGSPAIIL